jgi:hemoglobin-like flavoprotein
VTPDLKNLVRDSFSQLAPVADEAGAFLYDRLFEMDPTLRRLFPNDIREQGRKLMQMIAVAVNSLDNLEAIVPALQALGRRHVAYGVTAHHLEMGGAALLWTLERVLGTAFTPDVRHAWEAVYDVLIRIMQEGMQESLELDVAFPHAAAA